MTLWMSIRMASFLERVSCWKPQDVSSEDAQALYDSLDTTAPDRSRKLSWPICWKSFSPPCRLADQ